MKKRRKAGEEFEKLIKIVSRLRGPGGCSWDKKQTVNSLVNYLLEEAFEAAEACLSGKPEAAAEELGDIFMEAVLLARVFEEKGKFSVVDSLALINEKMVRRHPHVFGQKSRHSGQEIKQAWQKNKLKEKNRKSVLDGLPSLLPALIESFEMGKRASILGFDWQNAAEVLVKLKEELVELETAMSLKDQRRNREELGDLLFTVSNLGRHLNINPELALKKSNRKFAARFKKLERMLKSDKEQRGSPSLKEMDKIWEKIKKR